MDIYVCEATSEEDGEPESELDRNGMTSSCEASSCFLVSCATMAASMPCSQSCLTRFNLVTCLE